MKICLLSTDRSLYRVCREVLLGFQNRAWDFGIVRTYEQAAGADLLLWDLPVETPIPENADFNAEHPCIFLIGRRHLNLEQRRAALSGFNLVLKPVNPVVLRTAIADAISRVEARSRQGQLAEQMRFERDQMLQHLLEANLRLQEYDQDRTNFLARSVHDFRTPLAAVQGYCGLLLGGQIGAMTAEQLNVLERMDRSLRRLARLTSGMFQMSVGPQMPRKPGAPTAGDIQACLGQAVHEVKPQLESRNIQIHVDVTPPGEKLLIDEMQIEQVLVNLLDNACRFSPRNGTIELRAYPNFWDRRSNWMKEHYDSSDRRQLASRQNNTYRIEVRDSGPGVPAGQLERIFEEYISTSSGSDGSRAGLGLAVCHRIAEAHRGIVFAESKGSGATFVFLLPLDVKTPAVESLRPAAEGSGPKDGKLCRSTL